MIKHKSKKVDTKSLFESDEEEEFVGTTVEAEREYKDTISSPSAESDVSSTDEHNDDDEFYEMTSSSGVILGKVKVIKTNIGDLVHGIQLGKDERKVLVAEVYDNKAEA